MKSLVEFVRRHPVLFTIALVFVCLCPIMATRDFSPSNELRYISIVNEAFRDGHFFAFYNHGLAYADKPPLYFWLMMLCRVIAGHHSMFLLCLLSAIPSFVITAVMDKWLCIAMPKRPSDLSRVSLALMLSTTGLYFGMSAFLRMDMLMCMFIVLAMYSFYMAYEQKGHVKLHMWLLPVWIFLSLFSKGPVGILVPPLAISAFLIVKRQPKLILKYLGLRTWGVIAVLFAGWILGAYLEAGAPYINNLLFHQTLDRAVQATEHNQPIYYYAWMVWAVMMPYAFMTIPMVVAYFGKKASLTSFETLLTTTVVVTFVMLSLFSSKLAIYLAPIFPFVTYLFYPVQKSVGYNRWVKASVFVPVILLLLISVALVAVSLMAISGAVPSSLISVLKDYPYLSSPLVLVAGLIGLSGSVMALKNVADDWTMPVCHVAGSFLVGVFLLGFLVPQANDRIGYRELCSAARQLSPEGQVNTLYVSRPENMDVFLGETPNNYNKDVDTFLLDNPSGVLLVKTRKIDDNLKIYLEGKEVIQKGDYSAYKLDK